MATTINTASSSRDGASFWQQTWLLFQKNLRTKRRQEFKKIFMEVGVPIIYLAVLSLLVRTFSSETYPAQTESYEPPTNILNNSGSWALDPATQFAFPLIVHIAPDTEFARNFTEIHIRQLWNAQVPRKRDIHFIYNKTEAELEVEYATTNSSESFIAIILPSTWDPVNGSNVSGGFAYKIRANPDLLPSVSVKKADVTTCRKSKDSEYFQLERPGSCPVNDYFYSDFLALQLLVDQAILEVVDDGGSGSKFRLEVTMEGYPKEEYQEGMPTFMRVLIPLYSVIPLAQVINVLLVLIVTEKENKIKDGLRMVGVSDGAYWLSWLGVYSIIILILSLAFTLIFHFLNVLHNVDIVLLFLIFFLFGLSVITFAFALTPFFHKPKTAGLVGSLVIQFASLLFLVQTFVEGSEMGLLALKLISSTAFTTGLDAVAKLEYFGGVSWSDLTFGGRGEAVLTSLIFLIFDIFFYAFLAFYLDNVIPNEFGVRKHPLFLFRKSYWFPSPSTGDDTSSSSVDRDSNDPNYEPMPQILKGQEAIRIRNIRKTHFTSFRRKKSVEALKGVSLDIYENQITAILGRNGAGKSTLFNILTGLMSPTSGSATVFGLDTRRPYDMAKLRRIVGVCLQQDLLFPSLTAEEHLEFYGKLRGLDDEMLKSEINTILHELRLHDSRHVNGQNLSGGQKRKLSVGIALIGDPKVILLDEPSAGLDPVSRRNLWTLLQHKKEGKVILLTTHFMDEADTLADRKAIIHDGTLRCVGSSLFLKNKYGVGYYLTVELTQRTPADTAPIDKIISKWLPASLPSKKLVANEVKYSLPHTEAPRFPQIFADIELEIESGKSIKSYGVSMTTLEEVFLRISNDDELAPESSNNGHGGAENEEIDLIQETGHLQPSTMNSFWALLIFRFTRLIRSPQAVFFMMFMPLIFTAGGLAVANISTDTSESLVFDGPTSVYTNEELQLAVTEQSDRFLSFLNAIGGAGFPYSGNFSDLLTVNPGIGTMAAVAIDSEDYTDPTFKILKASMRINGTFLHSPPLVLDIIYKYFQSQVGTNGTPVTLTYEPFKQKENVLANQASLYSMFLLGPAIAFSTIGLVMEIVHDREIKARNHLRVNGVSFPLYYASMFTTFGLVSVFVILGLLALIAIFQVEALTNPYAMTILAGMFLLYIIPSQLFGASFSYLFDSLETAQAVYSQVASWAGMIVAIVVILLDNLYPADPWIVRTIHITMSALDVFYIPYGLFYWLIKTYLEVKVTDIFMDTETELGFGTYNRIEIIAPLICMLMQIPVFFLLLVTADVIKSGGRPLEAVKSLILNSKSSGSKIASVSPEGVVQPDDEDVAVERSRIGSYFSGVQAGESVVVAVKDLRKQYSSTKGPRQVLRDMSLMVEKGEVFGLLGHNGAGKTTTMRMITAEEAPDSGNVSLCGYDVESSVSEAFRQLGFCPQHDALWENMTLKEHLQLYAKIRGVPKANVDRVVEHFLKGLSIESHKDKHAEKLSGGTKRKLSYAMAMLGAPKIVLLDEPSTGMDPQSKRFLWNTILGTFKESRGAILTTHSMEEADVLCSRIGIMVKGSILCLGSSQHLKNKFGTGYTLEIKLKPQVVPSTDLKENSSADDSFSSTEQLLSSRPSLTSTTQKETPAEFKFIQEHFPASGLVEAFGTRAVFSVPNDSVRSISQTFALLESLKSTHNIEEYSFSQTTLEQVFLTFAKYNEDNEES